MQQVFLKDQFKSKLPHGKPSNHNDSIFDTGSQSNLQIRNDSVSAARIVSQSTAGDISSKVPVKTQNQSLEIATGSRTTDDLLQLSIDTTEVKLTEYPMINQRSSIIAARNNSTTVHQRSFNMQEQSYIIPSSIKKKNLKGLLGDYSSQTQLPQVRDSLNLAVNTQFRKNDPYQQSQNRSRVELSKKEMMQFQQNGVVSREFINQNKKELESFIKTQSRMKLDGNNSLDGSQQLLGLQYPTTADGSHVKKQIALTEEQKLLAGLDPATFVFSEDVKPDRSFAGETSQITSKVVENWINQTLSDAEHLDIPSVILKPENKIPITRYGIDRIGLTNSGLSHDQVDRIYRGLFVYSVGFYENIKKQISNCSKDQSLSLQTNLWKTFNVLLEYCCKTDYRLMISEITQKNDQEKQEIVDKYKSQMQEKISEMQRLKQNMSVMQIYQEQLEKEKNNEKTLRLKLEEEYMQISRNHEEEVSLRLKFEGKLNALTTAFRELEIKYDRVQQQFEQALMHQMRLDVICKTQSDELIQLRTRETDQLSLLEILKDFKGAAIIEIAKKNKLIIQAEEARKQAIDEADIIKYQVQDQDNQTRRLEMRIQDLTVGRISLENQVKTLESQIKDQYEKTNSKQEQLLNQRKKYEDLALDHTHVTEDFHVVKVTSDAHIQIINQLREQLETFQTQFEDHQTHAIVYKSERDELRRESEINKTDIVTTSEQLRLMNKERHYYEDQYNAGIRKIDSLNVVIQNQNNKIESNIESIQRQYEQIGSLKETVEKLEKKTEVLQKDKTASEGKLNMQINRLTEMANNSQQACDNWQQSSEARQQIILQKDQELAQQEIQIQELLLKQSKLSQEMQDQEEQVKRYSTQAMREMERNQTEHKITSDAIRKQLALEETVRYLTQQKEQLQQTYQKEFKQLQQTFTTQIENAQMKTEEAFSVMAPYAAKLRVMDAALKAAKDAEEIISRFDIQSQMLEETQTELQKAAEKIEQLETQLLEQDIDFDQIIENVMKIELDRIEEIQKQNSEKVASLNEQLIKTKLKESEQNKKRLKAEKQLESLSKSGSLQKQSTTQHRLDESKDSSGPSPSDHSKERSSVDSRIAKQSIQTRSIQGRAVPPSKGQKPRGGRFDQMIQDSKDMKIKQENVNSLIMGRQKHQQHQSHEISEPVNLYRTVIQKKNFKPNLKGTDQSQEELLSHTQNQESSAFNINQNSEIDLQQNPSQYYDQDDENGVELDPEDQEYGDEVNELKLNEDEQVEEEVIPVRDLQAEKFEEYKQYILLKDQKFLGQLKAHFEKIKDGLIKADSQQEKDELKKIMQVNEKLPDQFLILKMTEEQRDLLEQEQDELKFNFQVDNENILPPEDSDQESIEEQDPNTKVADRRKNMFAGKSIDGQVVNQTKQKGKERRKGLTSLFSQFAEIHFKMLDKLVQEHEGRVEKAAIERRKVKAVDTKIDGQVTGKRKFQYLIKMKQDPDYYELHRNLYLEAVKQAAAERENRETSIDTAKNIEKQKADEIARILLERHRAKVSKIVVEREYLRQPEELPQIKQVKADQQRDQALDEPAEFDQTAKRLLAQHPEQGVNASEPLKQTKHLSPVRQILDAVISMSNSTQPIDPELKEYIKGGVAGLNRQFNQSSAKRVVTGPASIRTLIRSVNSRYQP